MDRGRDIFGISKPDAEAHRFTLGTDMFGTYSEDTSSEGGISQFLRSAAYTAIQAPVDGVTQLVNHTFNTDWSPPLLVFPSENENLWTKAGQMTGMLADFAVVSRTTGSAVSHLGLAESAAAPMLSAGLSGALYATLLPVEDTFNNSSGDYWARKAHNAAILGGTFATMAGASQLLGSTGWLGRAGQRTFLQDVAVGGLSGAPAGAVNAELSSWLDGNGWASARDLASRTVTYGAFGAAFGGLNHGIDAAKESLTKALSDTYVDKFGHLVKIPGLDGDSVKLTYDESGQVSTAVVSRTDGINEIMRVVRGADNQTSWTIEGRVWGQSMGPAEPWNGSVKLDTDGRGVTIDGATSTRYLRIGAKPAFAQTPQQAEHWKQIKPAWDKVYAEMDEANGQGAGGAGLGAAAAGLGMMGHL